MFGNLIVYSTGAMLNIKMLIQFSLLTFAVMVIRLNIYDVEQYKFGITIMSMFFFNLKCYSFLRAQNFTCYSI